MGKWMDKNYNLPSPSKQIVAITLNKQVILFAPFNETCGVVKVSDPGASRELAATVLVELRGVIWSKSCL